MKFQKLKIVDLISLIFLFLTSSCIALIIWANKFQSSTYSNSTLLIVFIIAIFLTFGLQIIKNHLINPIISRISKFQILTILLITLCLSLLLLFPFSFNNLALPAPFNEGIFIRLISFPVFFTLIFFLVSGFYGPNPYSSALIMFWLFILLIYWPGIIGNVNINEVNNLFAGNLDNWHPVIFTLLVGISTKLFSTMTSILIFQIVCLGAVIGWGFSFLESKGVKKKVLWMLTIIFAVLPSNFVSVITLTDDISFSIALLAITIILLKIVYSDGAWLKEAKNMFTFALLALFASTLRYNGIPAIGFTLFCIILFFPNIRKNALKLIGIIIIGYLLINGPLFDVIGVNRIAEGHFDNILLHHISAHVDAGVFLNDQQKEYLDSLLPLDEWSYSCCTNSRMVRKPDFNKEIFYANPSLNKKIALDLFIQSPTVNLDHILCASDLVWNIPGKCEVAYSRMKTIKGNYYWTNSESLQYAENSKLPSLVEPLSRLWIGVDKNQLLNILIWRPAIYLYLSILSVLIFYLRNKKLKTLIILSPIIGQSAFLFAFNRIQNFRYQYCAVLIGLFLLGLVFIPGKSKID